MILQPFNNNGLELVINTETGEAFASISAVARMTDKDKQTIHVCVTGGLKTVSKMTLLSAQINTATGIKTVSLLDESQILEVVSRYKPELLIKFAQAGLRVYLHKLAGYQVTFTATTEVKPAIDSKKEARLNIKAANDLIKMQGQIPEALRQVLMDNLGDALLASLTGSPTSVRDSVSVG